jgi:cytochrome c5
MKRGLFVTFAVCWAWLICMVAAAQENQPKSQPAPSARAQETAPDESAEGEKLFHTHCGRCHNAPESISPREARAVVRHMRVRATLTNEDERLILKFLAP